VLIRYGILDGAAAEQLPPGHEVYVDVGVDGYAPTVLQGDAATQEGLARQFWTPLRICAFTLSARVFNLGPHEADFQMPPALKPVLAALADATVLKQMLDTVIAWPCGE
jgi:hypothetical protein